MNAPIGSDLILTLTLTDSSGNPVTSASVTGTLDGETIVPFTNTGSGNYQGTIAASVTKTWAESSDHALAVVATSAGSTVAGKVALFGETLSID
jgi:hypothetical protein